VKRGRCPGRFPFRAGDPLVVKDPLDTESTPGSAVDAPGKSLSEPGILGDLLDMASTPVSAVDALGGILGEALVAVGARCDALGAPGGSSSEPVILEDPPGAVSTL
jgi:hypothetical protein